MGHFHGNHPDPVFSGKFKNIRQAIQPVSLKRIRVGAGFEGPHPRALLPELLQAFHHAFHVSLSVYSAQPGKQMETVLVEPDPVVFKIQRRTFRRMLSKNPEFMGNADHLLHRRQ